MVDGTKVEMKTKCSYIDIVGGYRIIDKTILALSRNQLKLWDEFYFEQISAGRAVVML